MWTKEVFDSAKLIYFLGKSFAHIINVAVP